MGSISTIRNIRTVKGLRNNELIIDLGKSFDGELKAWMKKTPNSPYYRPFDFIDNRYLKMPKNRTVDIFDEGGCIIEAIEGKWYFEVEQKLEDEYKTIYTGRILFKNDITCTVGQNIFTTIKRIFNNQFNTHFS